MWWRALYHLEPDIHNIRGPRMRPTRIVIVEVHRTIKIHIVRGTVNV